MSKIYIETNKHLGLLRELWSGLIEHSSEKISEYGKFISYDQKEISVELIKIASSLKSLNIDGEPFVIQFISSTDLAGTNIVADEFARSAASLGMGPCLVINCKKNSLKSLDYEQQKISIVQSIEFDHSINKAVWKNTNEEEISYARLIDYNETWQKVYKLDLERILSEAKKHYKCIILDCPPLSEAPESASLSLNADGTILVLSAEITPRSAIIQARDSIINAGGNIIGIIFNQKTRYVPVLLQEYLVHP